MTMAGHGKPPEAPLGEQVQDELAIGVVRQELRELRAAGIADETVPEVVGRHERHAGPNSWKYR